MGSSCSVSILYDSSALPGFEAGWGFSALVSLDNENVLFDCGWDGHMLVRNMARLGIHPADIVKVVLSHSHWDHISGLNEVLSLSTSARPAEVYLPKSFSERLRREISKRAEVIEVDGPCEIAPSMISTGQLGSNTKEQSLLVKVGGKGLVVTGCAHPGIRTILERASELGNPRMLLGGLHDAGLADVPRDIERIVVCHCTAARDELLKAFGTRASDGVVGATYEFTA
jgi:7,8-dihydropterin-6-yl-methyl-4-(beta-D-ribofuranosyl)aminobenzene 5'-phosphate synthase